MTKDEAGAAYWFSRAANADNPAAQLRLARLYADGRGVDANPAEAARWYLIAKDHGLDDDYMEEWMRRLDRRPATTRAPRPIPGHVLGRNCRPRFHRPQRPPVDKQVE